MQTLTTLPSDMLDNIFDLLFHEEKLVVRQVIIAFFCSRLYLFYRKWGVLCSHWILFEKKYFRFAVASVPSFSCHLVSKFSRCFQNINFLIFYLIHFMQLRDNLHISARFPDSSMAEQFLSPHAHSIRDSKKIDPKTGVVRVLKIF